RGANPRWWHSLSSFVDSGPPPHRLQQLPALERAGIIRFLGPGLRVTADEASGRFRARGATGIEIAADALVDAFLPEPSLQESTNPLLRDLVTGGDAALWPGTAASPGALDTDPRPPLTRPAGTAPEPPGA